MHDLVVREGLESMAHDAAERLQGLISDGEEIPYEVHEPGDGSPLCRYEPLTGRFVRDHAGDLRELDSFGATCAALEASGLAGGYLERMGIGVPEQPRRRAELAGLVFLCRLWMDSSDFSTDQDRLEAAIAELERAGEVEEGQIDIIVPLRGLQLPVARLDLATASILRSDTVDVPAEARSGDGLGASPWEPTFLAVVRTGAPEMPGDEGEDGDPGAEAVEAFRRLITTLRLFKAGGIGLGPHAWTRLPGDRWRRIATGSGRPRPGGYRLVSTELADLVAFSQALEVSGTPFSRLAGKRPGFAAALGRALARFEAALERNVVVEALNDHLLALRFLLEGGGPASLGLSMRVAALCAEPERRDEVKAIVDRAIGLERELWSGEPAPAAGSMTPAETAAELEQLARAIFRDAAAGHLGQDLRTTADEILLADGFAVGDGGAEQRGGTTEWDLEPVEESPEARPGGESHDPGADDTAELIAELDGIAAELDQLDGIGDEQGSELDERIFDQPSPEPEEQIVIARAREIFEQAELEPEPEREPRASDGASPVLRLIEQTRAERQAHHDRVAGLFPPPEPTDWNVREIAYDRNRRARVS